MSAILLWAINPQAGGVSEEDLQQQILETVDELCSQEDPPESLFVELGAQAQELGALIARYHNRLRCVVAVGGDGTVNWVIEAQRPYPEIPVGILPMGTGNRLAHNLSVPLGFREAIQTILTGQSQPLDVGEANGTCFTLMAGAGLDAAIIDSANRSGTKPVLGMLAYAVSAVKKMLFTREVCFTVDTGREQVQRSGVGVMVANAGKLLGGLSLTPGYRTDDGLLDIAILAVHTPLDYVKVVFQGASGRLGSVHTDPGMVHLRAREVTIRSQPSVRVQVDGDVIGITPVTIRLVRQVLIKTKPA